MEICGTGEALQLLLVEKLETHWTANDCQTHLNNWKWIPNNRNWGRRLAFIQRIARNSRLQTDSSSCLHTRIFHTFLNAVCKALSAKFDGGIP